MKKMIAITGADGTGKSTLSEYLCHCKSNFQEVSIWDAMDSNLFHSKKDIDNYLCSLEPNARLLFLSHALEQALAKGKASEAEVLVLNGYYYKYFASEMALGADKDLAHKLISFFPAPNLVIKLEATEEIAFSRKEKLSRYECGTQSAIESNFVSFQKKVSNEWGSFDQTHWKFISSDFPKETVFSKALELIESL